MNIYPVGNYMFKVGNRNIRTRCEICSKLTIKIPERSQASEDDSNSYKINRSNVVKNGKLH